VLFAYHGHAHFLKVSKSRLRIYDVSHHPDACELLEIAGKICFLPFS